MKLDPRHLEHLAIIIDAGTFQEAANRIGTSQPALSRMISSLEARIAIPLFERTTRPLKATAMGNELADQGRAIRSARLRAAEMVDFGSRGFFGSLKIGAPPFLCNKLMTEAIAGFISKRPNIRIDLVPEYRVGLLERIYQNQIDVIIGPSKFIGQGNTELTVEPLFDDTNVIVGRSDHRLIEKTNIQSKDLEDVTWIGHSGRSVLRSDMENALKQLGLAAPLVAFQSESAGAVLELLKETDFLTVLPKYAIKADGTDGLGIADINLPGEKQVVGIISLAARAETRLLADFKAHLKSNL